MSNQTPKFLYFAYGSNMFTTRLKKWCPSASPLTVALAGGFKLEFSKLSTDGSGKGNLVRHSDTSQPGVLFEIGTSDLPALDDAEGKEKGYDRNDNFIVRRADTGEHVTSITYLATETDEKLLSYDWYLALIVHGAREHALGQDVLGELLATKHHTDPNPKSRGNRDAIALLAENGTDIAKVLHH